MDKTSYFSIELSYINNDSIRDLTKRVINHIPDYFFEIPASSTGKYHPEYSLGKGGLLRHVKAACKIANDVLQLEYFNTEENSKNKDYIIAALILHDSCKSGYDHKNKYTVHEHPILASDLIKDSLEYIASQADIDGEEKTEKEVTEYIDNVCSLIESHMGQWNKNNYSKVVLPKPCNDFQFFVHMFDYLASRKYITIDIYN